MIESNTSEDTVSSGNHRLVLHAGAIILGVLTLVGVSPLGAAILGH